MLPSPGPAAGRRRVTLRIVLASVALLGAACAAPRSDFTPEIAISPGVAGRLALMDRYRLHDEQRRLMMERPHVWAEDVPEEEDAGTAAPDAGLSDLPR